MKESDLFEPIKKYFTDNGCSGDGEVEGIDLYLEKDGLSTAVELKKTLDFKAIQQAALDQRTCDFAYIGIFRPGNLNSKANRNKIYLLKRLGIGLICVSPRSGTVEVVCDPLVSELSAFQRNHRKERETVKAEFQNRRTRNNVGGVHQTRLLTAYREEALWILYCLDRMGGQGDCKRVRELTGNPKSTGILYKNYDGWFSSVARGVYGISEKGRTALEAYREVIETFPDVPV